MEIPGKTVLVLGGAGLVGSAVCREVLERRPARLVVCSLAEAETRDALERLGPGAAAAGTELSGVHGNVFVRDGLKDATRAELLASRDNRRALLDDTLRPLDRAHLERSTLYRVLCEHRPEIVVDCVNTATALAYQDLYRSADEVLDHLDAEHGVETFRSAIERHLCTLYTPQLIRHIQVLYESLVACGAGVYVKIGTSGTGGMGLNIPYTHSEERPSRILLSKAAMGGAHTLLLFLMARTPDGPAVKEIKPAAAIAWKSIDYGPVMRRGRPVRLYDCAPEDAVDWTRESDLGASRRYEPVAPGEDGVLHSVYIDTGENGVFSRAEFEVLTTLGQMEFVTPEEIARNVRYEIEGINTGHDVITALDNTCMGPTYRAGVLRDRALARLGELEDHHGVQSVAFEMLGPPRLSKLLFEAETLRRIRRTMPEVVASSADDLASAAAELLESDPGFRAEIVSIGVPVLLPDGRRLLRGPTVEIPAAHDRAAPSPGSVDRWCEEGWLDLRPANMDRWRARFSRILSEAEQAREARDSSSREDRGHEHWPDDDSVDIGKTVGWLFLSEEHGARMKA